MLNHSYRLTYKGYEACAEIRYITAPKWLLTYKCGDKDVGHVMFTLEDCKKAFHDDIDNFIKSQKLKEKESFDMDYAVQQRVLKFIEDNEIECLEDVYQSERVMDNALDFIVDLCSLVYL